MTLGRRGNWRESTEERDAGVETSVFGSKMEGDDHRSPALLSCLLEMVSATGRETRENQTELSPEPLSPPL